MRDRSAERRHRRHLRIDVDELMVARGVGELVDHLLAHLDPVGHLFAADTGRQFLDGYRRHGIPLKAAPWCGIEREMAPADTSCKHRGNPQPEGYARRSVNRRKSSGESTEGRGPDVRKPRIAMIRKIRRVVKKYLKLTLFRRRNVTENSQ